MTDDLSEWVIQSEPRGSAGEGEMEWSAGDTGAESGRLNLEGAVIKNLFASFYPPLPSWQSRLPLTIKDLITICKKKEGDEGNESMSEPILWMEDDSVEGRQSDDLDSVYQPSAHIQRQISSAAIGLVLINTDVSKRMIPAESNIGLNIIITNSTELSWFRLVSFFFFQEENHAI